MTWNNLENYPENLPPVASFRPSEPSRESSRVGKQVARSAERSPSFPHHSFNSAAKLISTSPPPLHLRLYGLKKKSCTHTRASPSLDRPSNLHLHFSICNFHKYFRDEWKLSCKSLPLVTIFLFFRFREENCSDEITIGIVRLSRVRLGLRRALRYSQRAALICAFRCAGKKKWRPLSQLSAEREQLRRDFLQPHRAQSIFFLPQDRWWRNVRLSRSLSVPRPKRNFSIAVASENPKRSPDERLR